MNSTLRAAVSCCLITLSIALGMSASGCVSTPKAAGPQATSAAAPAPGGAPTAAGTQTAGGQFRGRIREDREAVAAKPRPIRNDVVKRGDEVVTLRYWKIKKGSFDEVYRLSSQDIWPFFDKLGARVIGMWKIVPGPEDSGTRENPEYDEAYLSTRYASMDHWLASREMARYGGNGPDWERCSRALQARNALTLETSVIFLKGHMADNGPLFFPVLDEEYQLIGPEKK